MKNIFEKEVSDSVIFRIDALNPQMKPQWGKMNAAQMLAHLNVMYELVYEPEKYPQPKGIEKFLIKIFAKNQVVGEKPYPKNGRTAPIFVISDERDFEKEKERLKNYIVQTQALGASYFEGKESHSFGKLTSKEWNNMFYKHIDHHLIQFGV